MPDEHWRAEIHETALLLEAVASGDRSRVVKQLTDYLLAKDERQAHADETAEEQHEHYEDEEEQEYGEPYGEDGDQYGYENDDYQQHEAYDDEYGAEVYVAADDDFQGEAYMSGAYNEADEGDDLYDKQGYDEGYGYDNNYNQTPYARHDSSAISAYKNGSMAGIGNEYDDGSYYQEEEYDPAYYEQADNAYEGQNDLEWNGEDGQYPDQGGAMSYGGGEWSQEAEYELRSDDQIQVVDEVDNYAAEQWQADNMYQYLHDSTYGTEDPGYAEEQEAPLYREIQVYPDPDDPSPVYAHLPIERHQSQRQQPYPDDTSSGYTPLPIERHRSQRYQPYPDDQWRPHIVTTEPPPEYSEVQHEGPSRTPSGMEALQRAGLQEIESSNASGNDNGASMQLLPGYRNGSHNQSIARRLTEDDDEDAAWEDEQCRDDDDVVSPATPGDGYLQFNPLSQLYSGPRLAMPVPLVRGSSSRRSWEQ
ncbi:hypothetical protein CLCR_00049 [Cladophialophora carrionii]|uniref:Uncharacterized protein n=1 Tax=Cladophialophora carrionii TaxID=86049 RepID=A0A1C1CBN2_9EURO|nr:hypothetical protein CLCR_00049 [Cladophialophora carrionii]